MMLQSMSIPRSPISQILYQREDEAIEAVLRAARELATYCNHSRNEFWTKSLPLELLAMLSSFDRSAAIAAAQAFLAEQHAAVPCENGP